MTSIPKTVAGTRTPFLERIEGGGAEVTMAGARRSRHAWRSCGWEPS